MLAMKDLSCDPTGLSQELAACRLEAKRSSRYPTLSYTEPVSCRPSPKIASRRSPEALAQAATNGLDSHFTIAGDVR
jgi:hypothetical protein